MTRTWWPARRDCFDFRRSDSRRSSLASVGVMLVLPLLFGARARGADTPLAAGIAAIEITPDVNLVNWVTRMPYGAVLDPLFVRALVLSDAADRRVVLLAFDLVETREEFNAEVRAAISKELGIPGDHVLLNASHSHSAPFSPTGKDVLSIAEQKLMQPQQGTVLYRTWSASLTGRCVDAVRKADASRRPATLGLARAWAGEVLFNRRPVCKDGTVKSTLAPANPYALPEAQRFGPVDPTLTWLSLRDDAGKPIAAAFMLSAHAVAVYGEHTGLSADWPGAVVKRLNTSLGVETMFLQGCAGDIVPWRRGVRNAERMGEVVAERALAAEANWQALPAAALRAANVVVELPFSERSRGETGQPVKRSEVQLITYGSLAIVALPGEPLTRVGQEIQERSPFPHTVVLGYSNGSGVQYVGVPGEKTRGGYEMGEWGLGSDEAGGILIEAAVKILTEAHNP
jgi:neutral ceramidase